MAYSIDISRRHWTRVKGPITLIGTWIYNEDRRWRPCMVLIRTGDEFNDHCIPCVVTADKAWIWSREVGDMDECARTLAGFIDPLRLSPNDHDIITLYWLINDHLSDLLHIPPFAPEPGAVLVEAEITDPMTGKVREVEIRDV